MTIEIKNVICSPFSFVYNNLRQVVRYQPYFYADNQLLRCNKNPKLYFYS